MSNDTIKTLEQHYQRAIQYAKEGEYELALEYVDRMHKLAPENDGVYLTSAAIKASSEDYYGCYKDSEKCVKLNPENASGWNHAGVAACELGYISDGLDFFKTAISLGLSDAQENYNYWREKV